MKMVAPEAAAETAAWTVLYLAAEEDPTTRAPDGGVVLASTMDANSEVRVAEKRMVVICW